MAAEQGVGKCAQDHLGSFGYPTRPDEPYGFCSQCGHRMVWQCEECGDPLPADTAELALARFCRKCGHSYFGGEPAEGQADTGEAQ